MALKYRPEIDGLRAIAILMVLLFHAENKFTLISGRQVFVGGYLGVDIFFVISGYLITRIILSKLAEKSFTLAWFYEKRARRLLPALFLVVITSLILARLKMLPHEMLIHAEASIYSLLFASNILYWLQTSYWIAEASVYPLLHTWSLAVEEHFYIIFPPILMLLWMFQPKYILHVIIMLALSSFALAVYLTPDHNDFTFFLLPARMWELMAGAFLAKLELGRNGSSSKLSLKAQEYITSIALLSIFVSAIFVSRVFPHPSYPTLVPVIATMLLIRFTGGNDVVSRILKSKLFVAIGLISYSLYLWHHLVFSFWSYIGTGISHGLEAALVAISLSFVLATLTYYFVEQPVRGKKIKLLKLSYVGIAVLIASTTFAGSMIYTKGYLHTMPLAKILLVPGEDWYKQTDEKGKRCIRRGENFCEFIVAKDARNVLLIGDSVAESLVLGLRPMLAKNNLNLITLNSEACYFAPDAGFKGWPCTEEYQKIRLDKLYEYETKDTIVIVAGTLDRYLAEDEFILESSTNKELEIIVYDGIIKLLDDGYTVVHVATHPYGLKNMRSVLANFVKNSRVDGKLNSMEKEELMKIGSYPSEQFLATNEKVFELFKKLEEQGYPNYKQVFPHKLFCDTYVEKLCVLNNGETQILLDSYHYTTIGATAVVKLILEEIKEVK